ncbi:MAG: ATP-binding protein [Chthoniobacteraceae bacterium]
MSLDTLLADIGAHLRKERETILRSWLTNLGAGRQPSESGLTEVELRDHMGNLLDDLCDQMQVATNEESEADALRHAEVHGDARWTQRYQLHQLVSEIGALRTAVIEAVLRQTAAASAAQTEAALFAHKAVHRFFDTFMADSASLFAARHEHAMSERQRQGLAQELHDGVCQELQGTILLATVLSRKLQDPGHQAECRRLAEMIGSSLDSIRKLAHGLSPLSVHMQGGLREALHELAQTTSAAIPCGFICDSISNVDPGVALHLYRVAQEAVANAVKHSGATRILITFREEGDSFLLKVEDDGNGFEAGVHERIGMGLHNIRHRARAVGGECTTTSAPDQGTCVTCVVPKVPSGATDWQ